MRYVRRVLQPGETIVYATKLHWFVYLWAIVLFVICLVLAVAAWSTADSQKLDLALGIAAVIFALLALSSAFRAFVRRSTTELAVTNQRVIYKTGLLARHTLEMNRARVESAVVDQTLLGRIFGYGSVTVRGVGSALEPIHNISDPLTFRSYLTSG
ncbi:MAG: PH domain-containing protein [Alphaproteobacteria bacterium]|nr:PH domain-containing protein [Alphaproteobacteria bacterium]